MIALREIQEVTSRSITVTLPDDFSATTVEVIILPVETPNTLSGSAVEQSSMQLQLQELLLTAPTLTEEETEQFTQVRDWMTEWRPKEY